MIDEFFAHVSKQIQHEAEQVKAAYRSHRPTSGKTKEEIVAAFLNAFMPKALEVTTGLVFSADGEFAPQADILVVDRLHGSPLGEGYSNPIWLVESVFALFEVKSNFSPRELSDAIEKCRRFKRLRRNFDETSDQLNQESLAIIWFFETPSQATTANALVVALEGVPMEERPDFIVSPEALLAVTGRYRVISRLGHEDSQYRQELMLKHGSDLSDQLQGRLAIFWSPGASLLIFLVWFLSWVMRSGSRRPNLLEYLPGVLPGNFAIFK